MAVKCCPFCGKKPLFSMGKKFTAAHHAGEWYWKPYIRCAGCGIEKIGENFETLLAWWNKRCTLDSSSITGLATGVGNG